MSRLTAVAAVANLFPGDSVWRRPAALASYAKRSPITAIYYRLCASLAGLYTAFAVGSLYISAMKDKRTWTRNKKKSMGR